MKTIPTLSPLVRGLSKLLEKGDWTFWMGDGRSYDFTPKDSLDYRVVVSRLDDDVDVRIGNRFDSEDPILTKQGKTHLRELCTRLYLEPYQREQEERQKAETIAEQTRRTELWANLERLGAT